MKKRIKYKPIVISAVILLVIGYLIYTGLRDTMVFYLTVSEVLAKPPEDLTQTQKVGGIVTAESVQWDPKTLKLSFKLEDKQANLIVNYSGVVPDSFKPGAEVIVEGTYRGDGKFLATTIMPKCASKYE
ncbi:MAG: cytochrome c maturation protein CcmE [Desulfobacterales bacterium]|nr:MAG: cytochrome c maturation protein CcmE [Desulfobacterales bacterium]